MSLYIIKRKETCKMNNKSARIYTWASIASAVLFTVMRLINVILFTEPKSGVYVRGAIFPQIFEYAIYAFILALIVFAYIIKGKLARRNMPKNTRLTVFTTAVIGFMFLLSSLLLLLDMVSKSSFKAIDTALAASGILASIYYLSVIFARTSKASVSAILSMSPILWAVVALTYVYFDMSILITSPNRIFNQLALLAFSVFLLAETRLTLSMKNTLLFAPSAAISAILLSVSSIPNLFCMNILATGESDRPIIYAVELAAALYAASRLYQFCVHGETEAEEKEE